MRIVRVEETVTNGQQIRLHHLTDLHVGAPDFDERAFLARRQLIEEDPWARWTMGGDGADLIRHDDRRYQPTELAPRYRQATDIRYASLEHLEELLGPIAGKCWALGDGNHERKLDNVYGGKFGVELSCNLGVPRRWVGYVGLIHVRFQVKGTRLAQLIDLRHGWQAGRSYGAFVNQAEKELGFTEADIILRGHSHKPAGHTFVTVGLGRHLNRVVKRHRTVLNGGCWRVGYRDDLAPVDPGRLSEVEGDMWQETKGFRSEPLGGPVLILTIDAGCSTAGGSRSGWAASVGHTLVTGEITAATLGL